MPLMSWEHSQSVENSRQSLLAAKVNWKVRLSPSGVHLFERNSGVNVLLDEIQIEPARWATAPRHVSVALTNTCDLACSYCFAPKNPASLDFQRLTNWLDELDTYGCLGVGFGGGEPTLFPRFADVCRYAAHHTELAVSFTTNARHLTDALIASLAGSAHFVRVSMDGVGPTYEALRCQPFPLLRRRLKSIHTIAPFGINYVVNSRTVVELDAAISFAADMGASEFLLLPEQPIRGNGGIDTCTEQLLRTWVHGYRGSIPLTVSEAGADQLPTCNPLPGEAGLHAYAHIDATGFLKRSSFDAYGVNIGAGSVMTALGTLRKSDRG
ncbi:MAG: radical SAM protein [Planctomycetaceae bacterium]|nr:radical SAM protein [Planctomycetaceae bacterium]